MFGSEPSTALFAVPTIRDTSLDYPFANTFKTMASTSRRGAGRISRNGSRLSQG